MSNNLTNTICTVDMVLPAYGGDLLAVNAGRVSYDRWHDEMTDRDRELIRQFANDGDTSPFYHSVSTFRITDAAIGENPVDPAQRRVFRAERSQPPLHQPAYPGAFAGGVAQARTRIIHFFWRDSGPGQLVHPSRIRATPSIVRVSHATNG